MPPSGWYDDPEQPWTWRYWDGASWTGHRAPMWRPPVRNPASFSVWFEAAVATTKIAGRRVGLLIIGLWLLLAAAGWWLTVVSLDDDRGRELRRLLDGDRTAFDPISPSGTAMTDAQAERAWELMQDIFWSALPWLVALMAALVVISAWSVALAARATQPPDGDRPDGLRRVMSDALGRVPAVLASGIVVFAVYVAVWAVAVLPVVLLAVADAGGAAIVLTAVFLFPLVLAVSLWLWGRLTLASVLAAIGGHGLGLRRSWHLTDGRFWFTVGRLTVTALIAAAAGGAVNVVSGFGSVLGATAFLAIVVVLQAAAVALSSVVTTSGHLATIDQLAAV